MIDLGFVSPDKAEPQAEWRSPLARALRDAPRHVVDLSGWGKLELRGEIDRVDFPYRAEVVRITPRRALVLTRNPRTASLRAKLRAQGLFVTDLTGALAGIQLRDETVLRRLTDLDLGALPAVGAVAHVQATVLRDGEHFRIFFPQEYSDYLAEVVLDALEGVRG